MHLDLAWNWHLNPHIYLHLDLKLYLCLNLQLFPDRDAYILGSFRVLHLQLLFHSLVQCLVCYIHKDLHLLETNLGLFWSIMCHHGIKLFHWWVTVSMPNLISIFHRFLWANDIQISRVLLISSVLNFRLWLTLTFKSVLGKGCKCFVKSYNFPKELYVKAM